MALGSLLLGQNRTVTIIWITFYIIKILVIAIQPLIHLLFLSLGCLDFPATELKASKKVNFLFILLSFSCITLLRLVHPVLTLILRGGFYLKDATDLLVVEQDVLVISDN
jgi:hypothetical protein